MMKFPIVSKFITAIIGAILLTGSVAANDSDNHSYNFKWDVGGAYFDTPSYVDGFSIEPHLRFGNCQYGFSTRLMGNIASEYSADWYGEDSTVLVEGEGFYSCSNKEFHQNLVTDNEGRSIYVTLLNGVTAVLPPPEAGADASLESDIEFYGVGLKIVAKSASEKRKFQTKFGPQYLCFNQNFQFSLADGEGSTFVYKRSGKIKNDYSGAKLSFSSSKEMSDIFWLNSELGVSALCMNSSYRASDGATEVGEDYSSLDSSQLVRLDKATFGVDFLLGTQYKYSSSIEFGVNCFGTYIGKVAQISSGTGCITCDIDEDGIGEQNFVPLSLGTTHLFVFNTSFDVSYKF